MLSIKVRQKYLKELGFYTGAIDGIEGSNTKFAYKRLQNAYFLNSRDRDGLYGKNTDVLLRDVIRVKHYSKNFKAEEFRCGCGGKYCTGYPELLSVDLIKMLQDVRNYLGVPVTITSGFRCKKYNSMMAASIPTSYHIKGKAVDIMSAKTETAADRRNLIDYVCKHGARFAYCKEGYAKLDNKRYNYPYTPAMGTSTHFEVY